MGVVATAISKSFPGTRALDRVDLSVGAGEVRALLGANGSGKSTLVRILTGVYQPDSGSLLIGERRISVLASPNEANTLGIAAVHQESPLVDTLTVAENIALFRGYPTARGRIRWRTLRSVARDLLERFGIDVDIGTLGGTLSPAQRALVALAIALDRITADLQLLILDEVTAALPEDQAGAFLDQIRTLAADGTPVLMVTHRLSELHGLAHSVTVLRDGAVVHEGAADAVDDEALVRHIAGVEPAQSQTAGTAGAARPSAQLWAGAERRSTGAVLEVEHLVGSLVRDVTFELHGGEIVGIGGLAAGGVAELPLLLAGALARRSGTIRVAGRDVSRHASPRELIGAGVALLPADRLRSGGVASLSVSDNVVLPDARRYWHRPGLEHATLDQLIERLDVRPPTAGALFGSLSGGNQQKVLLGKWLLLGPSVLILDDPTSGVDPAARRTIFSILREAALSGLAVLLFSTELEQLAALCSRVLVLREGRIVTELAGDGLTRETVATWCYT